MLSNKCNSTVGSKLFLRMLSETTYLHDWYLKDMYVANTGKGIHEKSKRGCSTIQIEMCTSNNDVSYMLIFIDVKAFHVSMEPSCDVSKYSFTSFGRCYQYCIDQHNQEYKHTFIFEGDAKEAVINGTSKYNWTAEQQRELLRTGRNRGYQGHHIKSVKGYPSLGSQFKIFCKRRKTVIE